MRLMGSLRFTDPFSNLGIAGSSRMLSARLSTYGLRPFQESVMSQFQILGRRPFPFKAVPIRFAYATFPDTITLIACAEASSAVQTPYKGSGGSSVHMHARPWLS